MGIFYAIIMATKGNLTFHTLKEGTGMTDKQLCKYIDEQQCRKLAGLFGSWEKYVDTPGLGLTPSQIADVRDCALKHGNEMAMSTALRLWLNYNLFKTYRSLIEILLELNEGSLAVKLATYGKLKEYLSISLCMQLSLQLSKLC